MDSSVISAIADVVIAVIGFGGGIVVALVTQNHTDKRHNDDIQLQSDEDMQTKLNTIEKKYQERFDDLNKKLDDFKDMLTEMKACVQQSQATIELRIESLEKKQDKHNSIIERTFKLEERTSVLEEKQRVANNRLNDLERHEENK